MRHFSHVDEPLPMDFGESEFTQLSHARAMLRELLAGSFDPTRGEGL